VQLRRASLADIAERICRHREAVSRELSRLGSIGLLRREGADHLEKLVREVKAE
jgi:predicted transcriptional regulator